MNEEVNLVTKPVLVFKQERPSNADELIFTAKNGYKCQYVRYGLLKDGVVTIRTSEEYFASDMECPEGAELVFHTYVYYDDTGKFLSTEPVDLDFQPERYTYFERKDKSGLTDGNIRFGPEHFPEGTRVKIFKDSLMTSDPERPDTFTVDHIVRNGTRSYVLVMKETMEWTNGKRREEAWNITHVERILERGKGRIRIEDNPIDFRKEAARLRTESVEWLNGRYVARGQRTRKGLLYARSAYEASLMAAYEVGFFRRYAGHDFSMEQMLAFLAERHNTGVLRTLRYGRMPIVEIDMRRLKGILRKHGTKFLGNRDAAERVEDALMKEDMDRMERHLDIESKVNHPTDFEQDEEPPFESEYFDD